MMCLTKAFSGILAIAILAGTAAAAESVASGKIKSINADNKTFILTDAADKDFTIGFGDNLVVNRAGMESKSDLKAGDAINVCYDKGILTWTAHYILVKAGTSKNCELIHGSFKGYDAAKKELTFTNDAKKDCTYPMGSAKVRVNMADSTVQNLTIGDHVLLIVDTVDGKSALHSVMAEHAK
jgi:Cu/Ag efflux protein CusF